ncbi:MAG: LuxR C-terminal-related transcriptional regulator, partial [Desulfonatronovibrionaceae bacterium]
EPWADNMQRAGYLEHTTAKVEDCLLSYRWFLEPLLDSIQDSTRKPFEELIARQEWAQKIVNTSRRHCSRGITPEMFFGCLKTLVHAVEQIILELPAEPESKLAASGKLRLYADALETIILEDWSSITSQESRNSLDLANRALTLEKNKYENILSSISDLVFIVNEQGHVMEANQAARKLFSALLEKHQAIWDILGLEGESIQDLVKYYAQDQSHEISVCQDQYFFELKIISLSMVSLASQGFIFVLNDITPYVNQRSILEKNVNQRTQELLRGKNQVEEMVITLKNVLETVEASKKEQLVRIAENIEQNLIPALQRIRTEDNLLIRQNYVDLLQDQLHQIAGRADAGKSPLLLRLSPAEMKISGFIKAGKSSKDIADALNISVGTVNTHRRNIRKKLGLQGTDSSLYTFLQHPEYS